MALPWQWLQLFMDNQQVDSHKHAPMSIKLLNTIKTEKIPLTNSVVPEPRRSSLHSPNPASSPYPEQGESTPHINSLSP
jgi:hypothetical protein